MRRSSKSKILKLKAYIAAQQPGTIAEALQLEHWKASVGDEYMALMQNGTWTLTSLPFA